MMKPVTRIAVLVLMAALAACGGEATDPEESVRAWVAMMESNVEEKNRRFLLANISETYADGRGNSHDDIDKMLRVWFLRQNSISLITSIDEINVIGDSAAQVEMTVGMAGTQDTGLGIRADAYRFELELEHDGEDWLLMSARWGELGDQIR